MRLLIDEMWPARLADQLRRRGHDVGAVAERDELRQRPDEIVFETALAQRRAIFTENVPDFRLLAEACLRESRDFYGLILTTDSTFPRGHPRTLGRVVRALETLLTAHPRGDGLANRVVWL